MFNIKEIKGLPTSAYLVIEGKNFPDMEPTEDPDYDEGLMVSMDIESDQRVCVVYSLPDKEPLTEEKVLAYLGLDKDNINPELEFTPIDLKFTLSDTHIDFYAEELTEGMKGMDVEFCSTDIYTYGAPHYILDMLNYQFGYYIEDGITMYAEGNFNSGNLVVEDVYAFEDAGLVKLHFTNEVGEYIKEDQQELALYNASMDYINKRQAAAK